MATSTTSGRTSFSFAFFFFKLLKNHRKSRGKRLLGKLSVRSTQCNLGSGMACMQGCTHTQRLPSHFVLFVYRSTYLPKPSVSNPTRCCTAQACSWEYCSQAKHKPKSDGISLPLFTHAVRFVKRAGGSKTLWTNTLVHNSKFYIY